LILNKSKRFPAKFKKNGLFLLDLNIAEKQLTTGHPVNFLSQIFFGRIFFKCHLARSFQNAQILAFWFSEWKVINI
jgi:hypothetical protein